VKLGDRVERATFSILGLLLLAAGLYALSRGLGTFGSGSSDDPLVSDSTRSFLGDHESWWWAAGAAAAVVSVLAGLALLRRQLRAVPRRGADPLVRRRDDGVTRVDRGALTGALEDELEHLPDVDRATARLVRAGTHPLVDVRLQVSDDADLGDVRGAVEDHALERFRQAIETDQLAAQVHVKLALDGHRPLR
jgi:hypothetical protein